MHSQRLAKAANMAVQGNEEAYDQLKSSQAFLSDAVKALKEGGEVDRLRVSPLPESYRTEEQRFSKAWDEISPSVKALIEQQDVLVRFDSLVNEVAALERELSASQRAARANIRDGAGNAPDLLLFSRLSVKMRTIVGEIIRMHGSSQFDSRDAVALADFHRGLRIGREVDVMACALVQPAAFADGGEGAACGAVIKRLRRHARGVGEVNRDGMSLVGADFRAARVVTEALLRVGGDDVVQ